MDVLVTDSFEVKGRVALEYGAAGIVAAFVLEDSSDPPEAGKPVLIVRPDGWMRRTVMGEIKRHGEKGRSCFLSGLTKTDVPVNSHLRWGSRLWRDSAESVLTAASRQGPACDQ